METLLSTAIIIAGGSLLSAFMLLLWLHSVIRSESRFRRENAELRKENEILRLRDRTRNAILKQTLCECESHLSR